MSNHHSNKKWISEECFRRSIKFISKVGRESKGEIGNIWDEQGVACQQFLERNPFVSNRSLFRSSEFVVTKTGTSGELVFRKTSCLRSAFEIFDGDSMVGVVSKCGIFRNRYTIDISGLGHWKFSIPLFSSRFRGESEDKGSIWVSVGSSKAEWRILVDPESNNPMLISVLAFIHNEYWNHG
jgi:hypothetical protein